MRLRFCSLLLVLLACSQAEKPGTEPNKTSKQPAAQVPVAKPSQPPPPKPVRSEDLKALLARVSYKPDPYETQPGCVSEPRSQLRTDLTMWASLSLARGKDRGITIEKLSYLMTGPLASVPSIAAPEQGVPRLEVTYLDGRVEMYAFAGEYVDPSSQTLMRTENSVPNDPTWVKTWLVRVPLSREVTAQRIVLDDRILSEAKRPDVPPRLSSIDCDDTDARGLKLNWQASATSSAVPLFVDIMRHDGQSFVELLPPTQAREVTGLTLKPADVVPDRDLVLQVSITDTFQLVSRAVLVPKRAL